VLAPLVDGVAVVVWLAQARREAVEAALRQLADVKVKPVGVIINRAEQRVANIIPENILEKKQTDMAQG